MLNYFADELKSIRISKNLTLQQVSVKTRIDYKFLEAMERGDFEFLPEIYVKSFLKEYLKVLGLDEQLYMKKFEAARTGKALEETLPPETLMEEVPQVQPKPPEPPKKSQFDAVREYRHKEEESSSYRKKMQKLTIYLTVGVIAAVGIIYGLFFRNSEEIVVPEKSWDEIVEDTRERYSEDENTDTLSENISVINSDSLNLTIRATDTTWIRIVIDDSRTDEFILFPGSQKSIKARNDYKLVLGNSRGVKLDLNGKALSFSTQGSVQRIQVDSKGARNLQQETAGQD